MYFFIGCIILGIMLSFVFTIISSVVSAGEFRTQKSQAKIVLGRKIRNGEYINQLIDGLKSNESEEVLIMIQGLRDLRDNNAVPSISRKTIEMLIPIGKSAEPKDFSFSFAVVMLVIAIVIFYFVYLK